jgi:hypothetical protein
LVAPQTYDLTLRLRGQLGSDGLMPPIWPIGSTFVLLNEAVQQLEMPLSSRGLARHYRVCPASTPYDASSAVLQVQNFQGEGLRPYPVSHLNATLTPNGDALVNWLRRTRIDGDNWQSIEVPLGETSEAYTLRIYQGATLLREVATPAPNWTYTAAMQAADAATGIVQIMVAQQSQQFGNGPFRSANLVL